jgi:hypothetical protein
VSGISDPGKAGRRDKRRAQKLIDAAYAAGQLTAADRAFRTDRVRSAHTKGDLAVLVRDLERAAGAAPLVAGSTVTTTPVDPTPALRSLGSAIPPDKLSAMSQGTSARTIQIGESLRSAMTGDGVRTARRIVLIVVVAFVILCGLGVASIVGLVITGVNDAMDSVEETPTASLLTADGWSTFVVDLDEAVGTTRVYDAFVYDEYASVNVVGEEGGLRGVYRDGVLDMYESPATPASSRPIDLADIDPELIETLPERTADEHEMPDHESAYLVIGQAAGETRISVYLQEPGRLTRWTIYDLDGTVVGGTPTQAPQQS